jgi:tRNA-binding protein
VNFPPRRIATFESEVLVLGALPSGSEVVLLSLERPVANGTTIG